MKTIILLLGVSLWAVTADAQTRGRDRKTDTTRNWNEQRTDPWAPDTPNNSRDRMNRRDTPPGNRDMNRHDNNKDKINNTNRP